MSNPIIDLICIALECEARMKNLCKNVLKTPSYMLQVLNIKLEGACAKGKWREAKRCMELDILHKPRRDQTLEETIGKWARPVIWWIFTRSYEVCIGRRGLDRTPVRPDAEDLSARPFQVTWQQAVQAQMDRTLVRVRWDPKVAIATMIQSCGTANNPYCSLCSKYLGLIWCIDVNCNILAGQHTISVKHRTKRGRNPFQGYKIKVPVLSIVPTCI